MLSSFEMWLRKVWLCLLRDTDTQPAAEVLSPDYCRCGDGITAPCYPVASLRTIPAVCIACASSRTPYRTLRSPTMHSTDRRGPLHWAMTRTVQPGSKTVMRPEVHVGCACY